MTPLRVKNLRKPGAYGDGGGLWLRVKPTKDGGIGKSWVFRFRMPGCGEQRMGLGSLDTIGLAQARDDALECRRLLQHGINPLTAKRERITSQREAAAAQKVAKAKLMTVRAATTQYIERHRESWTRKVWKEWMDSFLRHVHPHIGDLPVAAIDTALVMKVLEPIWRKETIRTASRVRGRLERVLGWAATNGFRSVENPARWEAHLQNLLPAPSRLNGGEEKHHEALPYQDVSALMARLRALDFAPARGALEFLVLTAVRSGAVRHAQWSEIDLRARTWTIAASKMKTRTEFKVPLSDAAVEVLRKAAELRTGDCVFSLGGGPLAENALQRVLKDDLGATCTVHGFRATFRTWGDEQTTAPHHVMEQALAHKIPSGVERAYRRGDMFEKRRRLIEQWARYCAAPSAPKRAAKDNVVVSLRG